VTFKFPIVKEAVFVNSLPQIAFGAISAAVMDPFNICHHPTELPANSLEVIAFAAISAAVIELSTICQLVTALLFNSLPLILLAAISGPVIVLSCISLPSIVPFCILSPLIFVILAPFQIN